MNTGASSGVQLEAEGGAVLLHSRFYVVRPTDAEFQTAITRGDSLVLVKGPRQVGKTSLLARGLQAAREAGIRVILTDLQTLSPEHFETVDRFCLGLGGLIAEQLDLDVWPDDTWEPGRSANVNLERYLQRAVLEAAPGAVVWGLDEVDRLFTTSFSDSLFALFRSWHNRRALEPHGPWGKLTLAISFATEAHLFIRDLNQSPFNVGTHLTLRDFTLEEVADLNGRYGMPLRAAANLERFYSLLGGHPFLTRCGVHQLATGTDLATLEAGAVRESGFFGDHLRRMQVLLAQDPELATVTRAVVQGQPCPTPESFYRLRGAGVLAGEEAASARPRCELYARYFQQQLG